MSQLKKIMFTIGLASLFACANDQIFDSEDPEVSVTFPDDGAEDVALNSAVVVSFNEDITESSLTTTTFTLLDNEDNIVTGSVAVDASNRLAVFTPSDDLSANTTYTATITTGVEDSEGNNFENETGWTFTTSATEDTAAPTLESMDPDNEDTSVDRDVDLTITFSEAMNPLTLTTSSITVEDEDSNVVNGDLSYNLDTDTLTFDADGKLDSSTDYNVTVTTDVQDVAGNSLAADTTWMFTTES